ncbi:helix-turn-helix transcriptional regulator [Pseudomonas delhiensis]|uniref:helix-turn-helix transcriptional regulator n=1 Tax=Pseudomonas delhiensis TaxID=366289 RepID=UPI000A664C26|nr:AlpA family transcriptional regulator [Pseudomonas delhiensis]
MNYVMIDRFMRLDEVLHTTGLGKNTLYRRVREGSFPKQVRIGPNSVAWRQSDITEWMSDPAGYSEGCGRVDADDRV